MTENTTYITKSQGKKESLLLFAKSRGEKKFCSQGITTSIALDSEK